MKLALLVSLAAVLAACASGEEGARPADRPDDATIEISHPVDVFFVVVGQEEIESEADVQVAATSLFEGVKDRVPDRGWIRVAFEP